MLYRDALRAAYIRIGPASFKGRRSRTRGRSKRVLEKILRSTLNAYLVWRLNIVVR